MAQSYQLISAQTLTSNASSITFSNIPQNYTDLRILFSARVNTSGGYSNVKIGFNGSTSNITWKGAYAYSGTLYGSNTGSTERIVGNANATSSTSSTFSNVDVYIANYTSTTYAKRISGDSVVESNDNTNPLLSIETVYWNPATQVAITSIELTNSANPAADFLSGSTFYLYGMGGARASGGTITADANYTYHTFTSTGTFTSLERIRGAETLVIAGGGGGRGNPTGGGGGGGAGGVRFTPGLLLNSGTSYTVTVGAGGAEAVNGSDSIFFTTTSAGGGKGGDKDGGGTGGSGGGGGVTGDLVNGNGGTASPAGQGNSGGNATSSGSSTTRRYLGAGGGGAGAAASNSTTGVSSNGGIGTSAYTSWGYATSTGQLLGGLYYYAGGGGGGAGRETSGSAVVAGIGGVGGGGDGGGADYSKTSAVGTANTGGGGGGGINGVSTQSGKAGGSGLVIIRYPNS